MLQNISIFILILALVIGFLVSGIFSDEFQTKADAIFFSARLGRNKGVLSKIVAGGYVIWTLKILHFVELGGRVVTVAAVIILLNRIKAFCFGKELGVFGGKRRFYTIATTG